MYTNYLNLYTGIYGTENLLMLPYRERQGTTLVYFARLPLTDSLLSHPLVDITL